MKKLFLYVGIILVLIGLIAFVNHQSNLIDATVYGKPVNKLHPDTAYLLDNPNYQNIIVPKDLKKAVKSEDGAFVYFFAATCNVCIQTTPVLNAAASDAGVELVQLNLLEFDLWRTYNIQYTPTLVYFENGKQVKRLEGGQTQETYKAFFDELK